MKRKLWKLVIPALLVIALIGYTAISAQGEFVQASYEIELQKPGAELEDARYLRDGNLLLVGGSESECFGVLTDTASQSAQPLWEISGGFRGLSVLPDRVVLACETARYQDGVVQKQIKLFSYGSSDFSQLGKTTVLRGLSDLSSGAFAAASDGTVYLLKALSLTCCIPLRMSLKAAKRKYKA